MIYSAFSLYYLTVLVKILIVSSPNSQLSILSSTLERVFTFNKHLPIRRAPSSPILVPSNTSLSFFSFRIEFSPAHKNLMLSTLTRLYLKLRSRSERWGSLEMSLAKYLKPFSLNLVLSRISFNFWILSQSLNAFSIFFMPVSSILLLERFKLTWVRFLFFWNDYTLNPFSVKSLQIALILSVLSCWLASKDFVNS